MFYFQGDLGPPGPVGLTGLQGAGIQGEKVGEMSHSAREGHVVHSVPVTVKMYLFNFHLGR